MKSLFACLSNQMAEQRSQHEQERTRLQQQHSAEKDSLVQEHQREVDSLEKQVRTTLQQHQQQSQEWRKCDAQVGGLHSAMFVHRHDDPPLSRGLPFCRRLPGVSKAQWAIRLCRLQAIEVLVIPYTVKMGGISNFNNIFNLLLKKKFG